MPRSRLAAAIVAAMVVSIAIPVFASPAAATTVAASGTLPVLRRAPYLTDVSTSTAMVNLATDTLSPAPIISWDAASTGCLAPAHFVTAVKVTSFAGTLNGTTTYQFEAAIGGLSAGTTYCYRAGQNGFALLAAPVNFTTAPAHSGSAAFSFAVIGDWGVGSGDEAAVFTQIAAVKPAFLMTVGDNVYNSGSQSEYGDLDGGNAFPAQYLPKIGSGTPIFPAQGNHGFTGYAPYLANFPQDAVTAASGGTYAPQSYCCAAGTSGTKTYASAWYAFTWGNARFYVLEAAWADGNGGYQGDFTDHWNGPVAGCGPCGQEMTWLRSDLAANAAVPLKFAFFHYPLHVDSGSQPSDTYLDGTNALEGVLANGGVQIAFTGHAHVYERNLPQIAGKPLVSYVTGGGGDPLGSVSGCSSFDAYAIGSSSSCHAPKPSSSAQVFHFLNVTVNGSQVTVIPINELGQSFDVQTYSYGGGGGPTVPGAPANVTAVGGNAAATVSWIAPPSDGGSPITGYRATAAPGGAVCTTSGALGCTVGGLTNGTSYTFTVTATNAVGTGPASAPSNAVVPSSGATVPGAPTNVTALAGDGAATVSWTAPPNGGSPITGYTVIGSPGGAASAAGSAGFVTVSGLTNGVAYTFTVSARNSIGTGPASSPSNVVTPSAGPTVPGAPASVAAVGGNAAATVSWTAPAFDGGSPITGYTVTAAPGGAVCTTGAALSCTVGGLTNGTSYTFTVTATNAIGTGLASAPSNPVTPTGGSGTPTAVAVADAYVSGAFKTSNFGTATTLQVGTSPSLHSYLMFDVEGLSGSLTNATLRLWTSTAGSGSSVHATSTAWTETGITYGNAPAYGSTVSTVSNFGAGSWISFKVTSLITGNGVVAFAYTSASATPISFASREDAAHAPQLILTP